MKLIKLNNSGLYIIVDDYNTKEDYDSRITKGSVFYKDELKDIIVAEYPPASKVSRPVIACTNPYSDAGIKNSNGLAEIDTEQLNDHLKHYTGEIDIKKLADDYVSNHPDMEVRRMYGHYYRTFIAGADAVLERVADKKFTLEDMEKALSKMWFEVKKEDSHLIEASSNVIQSITNKEKEKTEWDIEIEMELEPIPESLQEYPMSYTQKQIPKITNGYINILKIK